MKILKSAKQKNVVLSSEHYTEYDICKMLDSNELFFIDKNGCINHDSCEYMVEQCEVRIFTELIDRLDVEYNKVLECYITVAKMKNGKTLVIDL
jgi:hypothetical protein